MLMRPPPHRALMKGPVESEDFLSETEMGVKNRVSMRNSPFPEMKRIPYQLEESDTVDAGRNIETLPIQFFAGNFVASHCSKSVGQMVRLPLP